MEAEAQAPVDPFGHSLKAASLLPSPTPVPHHHSEPDWRSACPSGRDQKSRTQVAGVLGIRAGDRTGRGCLGNRGGRPYRSRLYLESGREILRFENEIRRLNTTWRPK